MSVGSDRTELPGESLVLGAGGVEVGFGSLGPDAQRVAGLFERGQAGVGGGVQLVALALRVGADTASLLGGLGPGAVGPLDSGGLGLLGACGFLLGLAELAPRLDYLAGGLVAGLADLALGGVAGLLDVGGGLVAELAELLVGRGAQLGQFTGQLVHAADRPGGGLVGFLPVGPGLVAVGLGLAAAVDLLGEPGLGGGHPLVGGCPGGVDLGLGRLHVTRRSQFGNGAGEGVGVLGGELLQGADQLGRTGESDGDGLAAGLLGPLAGRLCLTAAPLAVRGQRIVALVGAVLGPGAAVAGGRDGRLVAVGVVSSR